MYSLATANISSGFLAGDLKEEITTHSVNIPVAGK